MPSVTYVDADGEQRTVEAAPNATVMEVALKHDIPGIVGECGGACACATCHVYVDEEWVDRVGPAEDMEQGMLDFAFDVRENSRLSCQIFMTPELDGLIVHTPVRQG
ncbi:2Fe-2S iron-sulfur cluster-binding protein [Camelimonas lactis]|uniref:2Fe-2S ferredoxin n=1 Tax=Camelimonas lactis TaxID=659006 RepID=A0A4R2GVQ3_9HYPH|nr:2Fe-2S iron-sulfur cluster-binding protein [Camelimonas lactis]TCO14246.1 2Fe-2S ferredoxin [Camelimonas lactis]